MDDFLYSHTFYSGYAPEFLQTLYSSSKGVEFPVEWHGNEMKRYNSGMNQHPFLNIAISDSGAGLHRVNSIKKLKNDYAIINTDEYELKEHKKGYLYIDFLFPINKLDRELDESFDGCQYTKENTYWTPVVCPMIDADATIPYIKEERYIWHPFIRVGKTKSGHYFSDDYDGTRLFYKIHANEEVGEHILVPIYVYRLVAEAYLDNPNPRNYRTVHHILNNGYNNTPLNLMWVTDEQHRWIEKR